MDCTYNSLDQMKRLKKENILKVNSFACANVNIKFDNKNQDGLDTENLKKYLSKKIYW